MHDENAADPELMAAQEKITQPRFGVLFDQTVQIDIVLHGELAALQSCHEFAAEAWDGAFDVFVAEGDVQFSRTTHEIGEMGHDLQFLVAVGVGRPALQVRLRYHSTDQPVRQLSGGNQQKVVIGRWLLREPAILLLDEPTRGIDVAARLAIYHLIDDMAGRGKAILVASSEVEELMLRQYKAVPSRLRPKDRMVAHTGYLIFARALVPLKDDNEH